MHAAAAPAAVVGVYRAGSTRTCNVGTSMTLVVDGVRGGTGDRGWDRRTVLAMAMSHHNFLLAVITCPHGHRMALGQFTLHTKLLQNRTRAKWENSQFRLTSTLVSIRLNG